MLLIRSRGQSVRCKRSKSNARVKVDERDSFSASFTVTFLLLTDALIPFESTSCRNAANPQHARLVGAGAGGR